MSSLNNATSIIKGWERGFERTKSSYHEKCLDAVGIPVDWKATDNEISGPEKKYTHVNCDHQCSGSCRREGCNCVCGEWHGEVTEDELIQDSILDTNHIY